MNAQLPPRNHNNPPSDVDPIEAVLSEYDGTITEAQNWVDGIPVSDEAAMLAVDAVLKEFKSYKTALAKAGKERTDPLHKAWKAEVAAVKVYTDDADILQQALVNTVAPFKAKLAEQKEAERRAAWEAAEKARKEAEAKAAVANAANADEQRESQAAKQAALDAQKAAQSAQKDNVKGMRTVTHYEVTDYSDLLRWMNKNARDVLEAAADEYVRKTHKDGTPRPGVVVWQTKESF